MNRYQGLFFFDGSFRPVPLEQHFIGVKGKARSMTQMRNMEQVVFDKVLEMVREGHQVMVFVHARKETVKTAQRLREQAMEEGEIDLFDTHDHPKFQLYRRDISTSRNKEMKELFDYGFGIHHAGMLRSDRNMIERMFEDNAIKVLCCTSTLAWGVNLPAHAVIIKGTQVYDSGRGAFVDLSVLDVLQVSCLRDMSSPRSSVVPVARGTKRVVSATSARRRTSSTTTCTRSCRSIRSSPSLFQAWSMR